MDNSDLKKMSSIALLIEQENLLARLLEVLDELHRREYLLWERLVKLISQKEDNQPEDEDPPYADMELEDLLKLLEETKGIQDAPNNCT